MGEFHCKSKESQEIYGGWVWLVFIKLAKEMMPIIGGRDTMEKG